MDWLEEYAEKLRKYIKNTSIGRAALFYLFAAVAGSLACTKLTVNLMSIWINVMTERMPLPYGKIRLIVWMRQICPYFYMAGAIVIAGRFFIQNKIKTPMQEMRQALLYMSAGDLSFEMAWRSEDEFGRLVKDLENLRELLKREKISQWKMGEEQRKINAAFAHDIRTPLTVMNGYTEFLKKYVPQGKVSEQMLMEKLERISRQGDRLLSFSKTMTALQAMEKREVQCRPVQIAEVVNRMKESAEGIKRKGVQTGLTDQTGGEGLVLADVELILEAVENVVLNAVRYAEKKVEIIIHYKENKLLVYVKDDGEGFSAKALREADTVYFCERKEGEEEDGHFGIGLSITKMLCEKHGGELKLLNSVEGGAIVVTSFFVGTRESKSAY